MYKNKKQQQFTPRYMFSDWGIPLRQKEHYSQFKNAKKI